MIWVQRSRRRLAFVCNISLLTYITSTKSLSSSAASADTSKTALSFESSSVKNNPADSLIANERSKIKTVVCKEARQGAGTHEKLVHFIRHAEGEHNVAGEANYLNYLKMDYLDAELSAHGEKQCLSLSKKIEEGNYHLLDEGVDLLVVSPMLRTIQTASFVFPHLAARVKWISLECIREQTGLHPCDKRRDINIRRMQYPLIDFSQVESDTDPLYDKFTASRGTNLMYYSIYTLIFACLFNLHDNRTYRTRLSCS